MWWILWAGVAFFWAVTFYLGDVNWGMVALGAASASVAILWGLEMSDEGPSRVLKARMNARSGDGEK